MWTLPFTGCIFIIFPGVVFIGTLHNILLNPPPIWLSKILVELKLVLKNKLLTLFDTSAASSAIKKVSWKKGPNTGKSVPGPATPEVFVKP